MSASHSERGHFSLSSDLVFFRHLLGFTVGERLKAWGLGAVRCLVSELFHLSGGGVPHPGLPAACQPYKCVCVCVCVGVITHVVGPQIYPNSHIVVSVLPPGDKADSSIKPLDLKFRDRLLGPVWIFLSAGVHAGVRLERSQTELARAFVPDQTNRMCPSTETGNSNRKLRKLQCS